MLSMTFLFFAIPVILNAVKDLLFRSLKKSEFTIQGSVSCRFGDASLTLSMTFLFLNHTLHPERSEGSPVSKLEKIRTYHMEVSLPRLGDASLLLSMML
jgi:hypothetical protein